MTTQAWFSASRSAASLGAELRERKRIDPGQRLVHTSESLTRL